MNELTFLRSAESESNMGSGTQLDFKLDTDLTIGQWLKALHEKDVIGEYSKINSYDERIFYYHALISGNYLPEHANWTDLTISKNKVLTVVCRPALSNDKITKAKNCTSFMQLLTTVIGNEFRPSEEDDLTGVPEYEPVMASCQDRADDEINGADGNYMGNGYKAYGHKGSDIVSDEEWCTMGLDYTEDHKAELKKEDDPIGDEDNAYEAYLAWYNGGYQYYE